MRRRQEGRVYKVSTYFQHKPNPNTHSKRRRIILCLIKRRRPNWSTLWCQAPVAKPPPVTSRYATSGRIACAVSTSCLEVRLGNLFLSKSLERAFSRAQHLKSAMPQPLSSKESSLFRQVIRNYEDKQYKKGGVQF
jgi:hypothetical protein